jgi:hypothetical protein
MIIMTTCGPEHCQSEDDCDEKELTAIEKSIRENKHKKFKGRENILLLQ